VADADRAVFKIQIAAKVADVWKEITRTDRPIPAFFNMRMHTTGLKTGAPMQMRTISGKYAGVVGEVLEFDPPRRFAHTFKFTNLNDPPCKVIYELREAGGGCEFTMILEDLPVGTKTAKQMKQGATMILNTLKAVMETGRPSFGTRMLFGIFRLTEPLSPKSMRVENWPLK
jgi:uncharacterized protein YndB with AHSA1/START domain